MLRTALAGLLALASVWEGPVTLPSDDHFNDTFQKESTRSNLHSLRESQEFPYLCTLPLLTQSRRFHILFRQLWRERERSESL